ncbi:MAG: EutN/CcmL family microcompartment protein [Gammaproteobacteria bacterium]|nr:EutN/CcmL family microcompartment protein [Gammaproteobacteria bacterium]
MITGAVIGEIHSTINHPFYDNRRMLIVEKIDFEGVATGDYLVAVDQVSASAGTRVLVLDEGNGARQVLASEDGPVRSVIVGIIDHMSIE